jgi:hypothetical protein
MENVFGVVGGELEGLVFLGSSVRLVFSLEIARIAIKRELVVKNDWC